jgi:hypothetical protein
MISPVSSNRIIPLEGTRETQTRQKNVEVKKPVDTVTITKVEMNMDKVKEVPRDQVGQCDNLTASYWG